MNIHPAQMPEVFFQIIEAPADVIRLYKQGCQQAFDNHTEEEKKYIQHLQTQLTQLIDILILQKETPENQKAV